MDYKIKKLKIKNKRLKEKLKEANSKILMILQKRITDPYLPSDPFPMDHISLQLRNQVLDQQYRYNDLLNKTDNLY